MEIRRHIIALGSVILFLLISTETRSQDNTDYGRNAISFNLTRDAVCEANMSIEHFFNSRRSIEFNGGIVYVNQDLVKMSKDWTTTPLFSEHGYSARIHYKIFKRQEEDSRWRDYIAPGIVYKNLYYNEQWFENEKTDQANGSTYHERILQSRARHRFGIEFLWGKVFEMNRTFAFEFYYGAGLMANIVRRTDFAKQADDRVDEIVTINRTDNSFYVRPTLQLGLKFRIRF